MIEVSRRCELLARGAAQWRDPDSAVRREAREALRDSPWSPAVIEAALDNVLWDLDETRASALVRDREGLDPRPVLVILPNSIAPLAQIAIGGPEGSQVDAGVAGRGGGGYGSLLMGGKAFAAVGS